MTGGSGRTTLLDTSRMPPADRIEGVRDIVWATTVRVDIDWGSRVVDARAEITDLGRVSVCSVRAGAARIRRTPALVRRDDREPCVFLSVQRTGSSLVVQSGREAVLRAGDLAIYDATRPYTLVNDGGIHQHFFRFPTAALGIPPDLLAGLCAVPLRASEQLTRLSAAYFARVAGQCAGYTTATAEVVDAPSTGLLRALLAAQLPERALARRSAADGLVLRVTEYARAHLGDHDLSAGRIAAAHHVSVRHLYSVLERAGIPLGDWIRDQRLQECRRALADREGAATTIAALAHRWGFQDASSFSRAFRAKYGISPRDWRSQHRS